MEEFEAREHPEGDGGHDAPNDDPGTEEDPDADPEDQEDPSQCPGDPDPGDPPPDVRAAMQEFLKQEAASNANNARAAELERTIPLPTSR